MRVQQTQQRAALAVNAELIRLYWQIGRDILHRQERQGWGAKVIDRLSHDLGEEAMEREVEQAVVDHLTQYLVELGAGFAYVGRQVHLTVGATTSTPTRSCTTSDSAAISSSRSRRPPSSPSIWAGRRST
ncbi:MAG: PDDEXK nuclease domain-containing protein [Aeromicrobium sp.]